MTPRELAARVWAFVTRAVRRRDEDDEVRFHLEMLEDELVSQGWARDAARRETRIRFGGAAQTREAVEDQRSIPWLEHLLMDARFALRMMGRAKGVTVSAVVTLAIAIGANTAIFSVVYAVLIRPLPYAAPDRLVAFGDRQPNGEHSTIGFTTVADIRDEARSFEQIVAVRSWQATLLGDEPERLTGMRVSAEFFSMLGVQPALGRTFRVEEDHPDRARVLILSDAVWRRRFNADPTIVGRRVRINDVEFEIVGVMPSTFEPLISGAFYQPADVWAPLGYARELPYACRGCRHLNALGRVKDGRSIKEAEAELNAIRARLRERFPNEYTDTAMVARPLAAVIRGDVRTPLLVLFGAVGFILLIACANVANLLLARAMTRSREMAIRVALGAGRGRLVAQMLTESAVLSVAGGLLGILVAAWILPSLASLAPVSLPRVERLAVNGEVLLFALAASLATGLVFGLVPAWRASAFTPQSALADRSRGTVGARSGLARQTLVALDVALALVLLAGAALMLKTVGNVMRVDPGFTPGNVLSVQFSLIGERYREDGPVRRFIEDTVSRVRAVPGVEAAAAAGQIPMGGNVDRFGFHIDGLMEPNPMNNPNAERYSVTPDYFRVMGIPLLRGRLFTEADTDTSPPVMLVSATTARDLFKGHDAIGRRVRVGPPDRGAWRTIVGVVGDVHHADLTQTTEPQFYLPQSQFTDSYLVLVVKTSLPPAQVVSQVRAVIRSLDPAVALYDIAPVDQLVAKSFADRRFVMFLLAGFAVVAVLLAAIGLYGVVAYMVSERTREVGVRVALGASSRDVFTLVLGSGMRAVIMGIVAGLAGALAVTQALGSLLFGVGHADPAAFAAAAAVLLLVAVAAHVVPASRALAVDPAIALRND